MQLLRYSINTGSCQKQRSVLRPLDTVLKSVCSEFIWAVNSTDPPSLFFFFSPLWASQLDQFAHLLSTCNMSSTVGTKTSWDEHLGNCMVVLFHTELMIVQPKPERQWGEVCSSNSCVVEKEAYMKCFLIIFCSNVFVFEEYVMLTACLHLLFSAALQNSISMLFVFLLAFFFAA